jgi:hypothetical protein
MTASDSRIAHVFAQLRQPAPRVQPAYRRTSFHPIACVTSSASRTQEVWLNASERGTPLFLRDGVGMPDRRSASFARTTGRNQGFIQPSRSLSGRTFATTGKTERRTGHQPQVAQHRVHPNGPKSRRCRDPRFRNEAEIACLGRQAWRPVRNLHREPRAVGRPREISDPERPQDHLADKDRRRCRCDSGAGRSNWDKRGSHACGASRSSRENDVPGRQPIPSRSPHTCPERASFSGIRAPRLLPGIRRRPRKSDGGGR